MIHVLDFITRKPTVNDAEFHRFYSSENPGRCGVGWEFCF